MSYFIRRISFTFFVVFCLFGVNEPNYNQNKMLRELGLSNISYEFQSNQKLKQSEIKQIHQGLLRAKNQIMSQGSSLNHPLMYLSQKECERLKNNNKSFNCLRRKMTFINSIFRKSQNQLSQLLNSSSSHLKISYDPLHKTWIYEFNLAELPEGSNKFVYQSGFRKKQFVTQFD